MYDIMITIIKNLTVLHVWKNTTTCLHFNNNELCCQPITKVASNRWSNDLGPRRGNKSPAFVEQDDNNNSSLAYSVTRQRMAM